MKTLRGAPSKIIINQSGILKKAAPAGDDEERKGAGQKVDDSIK